MTKGIKIPTLHCNQCEHDWTPSKPAPKCCPKCKRYNWAEPKREAAKETAVA